MDKVEKSLSRNNKPTKIDKTKWWETEYLAMISAPTIVPPAYEKNGIRKYLVSQTEGSPIFTAKPPTIYIFSISPKNKVT